MPIRGVSTIRQTPPPPQSAGYLPPPRQPVFSRSFLVSDTIGEESPPWAFLLGGHLMRFVGLIRVPAIDNTVVSLRLSGVEFEQLIIPAGQKRAELLLGDEGLPFNSEDFLTVMTLSGGTNGEGITIIGDPR